MEKTAEAIRLEEARHHQKHWKRWGPYLSERAWGTVREDYSPGGTAWEYLPHDHARSRAYRWNEDGLAGISDRHQRICFAIALWNRRDPILKERLFGLTGSEGNHGEDVKEYYFYVDSTPTHSYMKFLYKYPQAPFPYADLVSENGRRSKHEGEYELVDTGVFVGDRYLDVEVEYAKADADDILIRLNIVNRGPEAAAIDVLPTVWFRNTWSWSQNVDRPSLARAAGKGAAVELDEPKYGRRFLHCGGSPELLFTENETNTDRVFGYDGGERYTKDAFHRFVVDGQADAINPAGRGTKAAARYALTIPPGATATLRLRLNDLAGDAFGRAFDEIFELRREEADEFYATVLPDTLSDDARNVARQACAGLLWSKQYYHYVVKHWLDGDPAQPAPPADRQQGRNREWTHLYNADVISMPDKWEYPWYAAWDLAFHCVALALVDSDFAKDQLTLLLREWYMHPNGQLPAYEWALGDVNPPVHAWAAWRVYKIEQKRRGTGDLKFLERVFHKLLLNFTWWVNRKDAEGMNIFQGGFLGLDNIGVFDRSAAAADRRPPRAVRRHELDGDVLAQHARDRDGAREARPGVRGRREQVLGALPQHRARHERRTARTAARATISGTTRTASSTTSSTCRTTRARRSRSDRWSASSRCWRSRRSSPAISRITTVSAGASSGSSRTVRISPTTWRA